MINLEKVLSSFSVECLKTKVKIKYKKKVVCDLKVSDIVMVLKDLADGAVSIDDAPSDEINTFLAVYNIKRNKALKVKTTTKYTKKSLSIIDKQHIEQALLIMDNHGVTPQVFIDAQIKGLDFTDNFPSLNQMSTPKAEERLVTYLNSKGVCTATEGQNSQSLVGKDALHADQRYRELSKNIRNEKFKRKELIEAQKLYKKYMGKPSKKLTTLIHLFE